MFAEEAILSQPWVLMTRSPPAGLSQKDRRGSGGPPVSNSAIHGEIEGAEIQSTWGNDSVWRCVLSMPNLLAIFIVSGC